MWPFCVVRIGIRCFTVQIVSDPACSTHEAISANCAICVACSGLPVAAWAQIDCRHLLSIGRPALSHEDSGV